MSALFQLRRVSRDSDGAAALEFAMMAPLLFLMMFGTLEMAQAFYIRGVLMGAVNAAGRNSTLQTGSANQVALDASVTKFIKAAAPAAVLTFTRKNYASFGSVGQPEDFTDTNGNGVRNSGECFTDMNGNATWDSDMGQNGLGGANDVVLYTVSVKYTQLFQIATFWGLPKSQTINAATVLQNQPFSTQATRTGVKVCT